MTVWVCSLKVAVVSSCLLGEFCRYDGKTKEDNRVKEFLKDYKVIPFCPEAPLFGIPRERIDIIQGRVITSQTKKDVTKLIEEWTKKFIQTLPKKVDIIILKSKSPSCGLSSTPIWNENKEKVLRYGDGIAAGVFKQYFKDVLMVDENSLNT